jgi:hypothetical protein
MKMTVFWDVDNILEELTAPIIRAMTHLSVVGGRQ